MTLLPPKLSAFLNAGQIVHLSNCDSAVEDSATCQVLNATPEQIELQVRYANQLDFFKLFVNKARSYQLRTSSHNLGLRANLAFERQVSSSVCCFRFVSEIKIFQQRATQRQLLPVRFSLTQTTKDFQALVEQWNSLHNMLLTYASPTLFVFTDTQVCSVSGTGIRISLTEKLELGQLVLLTFCLVEAFGYC